MSIPSVLLTGECLDVCASGLKSVNAGNRPMARKKKGPNHINELLEDCTTPEDIEIV